MTMGAKRAAIGSQIYYILPCQDKSGWRQPFDAGKPAAYAPRRMSAILEMLLTLRHADGAQSTVIETRIDQWNRGQILSYRRSCRGMPRLQSTSDGHAGPAFAAPEREAVKS